MLSTEPLVLNLTPRVGNDELIGVQHGIAPEDLASINARNCAAVIWHRQPLESFQNWIDRQAPQDLPRARMVLRLERVHDAIRHLFDSSTLPDCQERDLLIGDIAAQADLFAHVMAVSYLRLRLDVVTTNAYRQFHKDAVTARLICTYRGTGTQYGTSSDDVEPVDIFTVPTGSPVVFRGMSWPETPAIDLRHRSPQIEGTGETRLVLVLDPVFELSDGEEQQDPH